LSGLFAQIEAFLLTLFLGVLSGLIFHYYQLTVRYARIGKHLLYILDFVLWIFMIFLVFMVMLIINQGEMRVYVLIALLIGIIIYYRSFSSRLEPLLYKGSQKAILVSSRIKIKFGKGINWCFTQAKTIISVRKKNGDDQDD